MTELDKLAGSLALTNIPESWKRNWDQANASFPVEGIPFLQPDYLESAAAFTQLSEDQLQAVLTAASHIRSDESLCLLAWLWHYVLFQHSDYTGEPLGSWPVPSNAGPSLAALFPLILLLSGTTRLQEIYASRSIPDDIVIDTVWDVRNSMGLYQERNGIIGLGMSYFAWLMSHYKGNLYMLGRLQFRLQTFGNHLYAYRNIHDGRIIALAAPDLRYRNDGLLDGTNRIYDSESGWTSIHEQTVEVIKGNLITTDGYAIRQLTSLNTQEWSLVLSPGDTLLDVHIPAVGKLNREQYNNSYEQAISFFNTYFPESPYKGFVCYTWLFDPQLRSLLGESSNIVQFQKDYHLFPTGGTDDAFYQFLFKCAKCEAHLLPEHTTMQQTIKAYMLSGGHMRTSGGFMIR
ncbi:MAG: hypothetical protein K0R67_826 [Paenibacillus sp.]|nr:hypothetical protein [Paenibacillus sp.]